MKSYTPEELAAVIAEHGKWIRDEGGSRADLSRANLSCADLSDADLSDADLSGADLRGADLRGADLSGADLRRAYLSGADLRGAYLRGADLSRAYLSGADLGGAYLSGAKYKATTIKIATAFTGIYKYIAMPIVAEDGVEWIRLGCHFRTAADWAADFWNNPGEFPNNGDIASADRWNAYQTCLRWLESRREPVVAKPRPKPMRDAKGHFVKRSA